MEALVALLFLVNSLYFMFRINKWFNRKEHVSRFYFVPVWALFLTASISIFVIIENISPFDSEYASYMHIAGLVALVLFIGSLEKQNP